MARVLARAVSRGLTRGLTRVITGPDGPAPDPDFSSVTLLSGFEGADTSTTFDDESEDDRTMTAVGNAQIDTAQFKFGTSSLLLDGVQNIDDLGLMAPPVIQVIFDDGVMSAEDVTSDALPAGAGTDRNQFEFLDGKWHFNLKTRNFNAAGTYMVTMESGDANEYLVDPTCTGKFVID